MPSLYGNPYSLDDSETEEDVDKDIGISNVTLGYLLVLISLLVIWFLVYFSLRLITLRQKTRSSQQRRPYTGARQRPSDTEGAPTIYVSPANLPPPPKYEAMAPPSYEEVVGIHYPNFQPISQPITTALARNSNSTDANTGNVHVVANNNASVNNGENVINSNTQTPAAVLSVISERPPVASS